GGWKCFARFNLDTRGPVNNARRILESFQQWMVMGGVMFQAQIGVLHPRFNFAVEIHAEQPGEPEVVSPYARFAVQAGFAGGNHASASLYKILKLPALQVRERDDVRQDERLELADVRGIQQPIVHELERN